MQFQGEKLEELRRKTQTAAKKSGSNWETSLSSLKINEIKEQGPWAQRTENFCPICM